MKRLMLAAGLLTMLGACGKEEASKQTTRPALVGKALEKKQNAAVARMFSVQGRWQAQPVASDSGRYLVVDIAGDSQFNMDLKGQEGGKEAIFASATGKYSWSKSDVMEAKATSGATGPLLRYGIWQAGFPAEGVMLVRAGDTDVELTKIR